MVFDYKWFSPTREIGLASYAASFLACVWRSRSRFAQRESGKTFGLLAGVQLCLFLDMAFDWRWKLHEIEMQAAGHLGLYGQRRIPQVLALLAVLVALFTAITLFVNKWRGAVGITLCTIGTSLAVGLWFCEVISFHFMDYFMYQTLGRVMVVSVAWASISAIICLGIWLDSRRDESE